MKRKGNEYFVAFYSMHTPFMILILIKISSKKIHRSKENNFLTVFELMKLDLQNIKPSTLKMDEYYLRIVLSGSFVN